MPTLMTSTILLIYVKKKTLGLALHASILLAFQMLILGRFDLLRFALSARILLASLILVLCFVRTCLAFTKFFHKNKGVSINSKCSEMHRNAK